MAADTETTPLLARSAPAGKASRWLPSVVTRILVCGFLTSLSFAFTQVPMLYAFRLMTCDDYYKTHPLPPPGRDRCAVHAIEAATAKEVAILSTSTTIVGVMNLLLTGWEIKRFGVRFAMVQQTFWPSVRLCWQAVGIETGGRLGIVLVQTSQLTCFFGGPAGYMLVLNSFVSELVGPKARTGAFGRLQGMIMMGTATGYLVGGLVGNLGIRLPWDVALCSMVTATVYSAFVLPYVAPAKPAAESKRDPEKAKSLLRFLGPVKVFAPQTWRLPDGKLLKHWGVLSLVSGTFCGVLATGYIPTLLQMYSTIAFGFGTLENGLVMSFFCAMRGVFLTLIFPRIISSGRKWFASRSSTRPAAVQGSAETLPETAQEEQAETRAENVEAAVSMGIVEGEEPEEGMAHATDQRDSEFDLFFLKWSLVLDGFLTGLATFSSKGWHIAVVAGVLPIASGSAPAAKSVIIEMCPPSQKADALNAISLMDMIAKLSTVSLFGVIFSALAEVGKPSLVFTCNAAVAVLAVALLVFCHFPPQGSKRVEVNDHDESEPLLAEQ